MQSPIDAQMQDERPIKAVNQTTEQLIDQQIDVLLAQKDIQAFVSRLNPTYVDGEGTPRWVYLPFDCHFSLKVEQQPFLVNTLTQHAKHLRALADQEAAVTAQLEALKISRRGGMPSVIPPPLPPRDAADPAPPSVNADGDAEFGFSKTTKKHHSQYDLPPKSSAFNYTAFPAGFGTGYEFTHANNMPKVKCWSCNAAMKDNRFYRCFPCGKIFTHNNPK